MAKNSPGIVRDFAGAVYGGASIALGATAYLSSESKVAGALFFSVGLFMIYTFGFHLYTGKVCRLPPYRLPYLLLVLAGNIVGACGIGWLLLFTRLSALSLKAAALTAVKLEQSPLSAFILSVLCGVMVCVAVKGFESIQNAGKYFALVLPVMVFLFAGFDHSVANLFYFSLAGGWSLKAVGYMAIFILGNTVGGALIPLFTGRINIPLTDAKK